jgi:HTH-type transcriptional regulator/antitoxin HigA
MDIRPIRNDNDHRPRVGEVKRLCSAEEGTQKGTSSTSSQHSSKHMRIGAIRCRDADPTDILHFAIEDMGHPQAEPAQTSEL